MNYQDLMPGLEERVVRVNLSKTAVYLRKWYTNDIGTSYINLHENEQTAVRAALETIRRRGGCLQLITHQGERYVTFQDESGEVTFDPNRMFTDRGAELNLAELNRNTLTGHHRIVRDFAERVLDVFKVRHAGIVITVHNNDSDGLSLDDYLSGGQLADDASDTHLADGRSRHNFYFVTEYVMFESLAARGYNVVLQDNENVVDDGSLSVYCGRNGIPYMNVEAIHGDLNEQIDMTAVAGEIARQTVDS